jgi:hypothetical protein
MPKSSLIPRQYQETKMLLGDKLELKLLGNEDVKVAIAMNENIARISFSDLRGKMAFNSIRKRQY